MNTNLINARRNKGLTQVQVARKANISENAYQNYEAGKRTPNVYVGQRIAKALNTKVEKIFPLSNDDTPNSHENNNMNWVKKQPLDIVVEEKQPRRCNNDDQFKV